MCVGPAVRCVRRSREIIGQALGLPAAFRWPLTLAGACLLFLLLTCWHPSGASAATITVTNTNDTVGTGDGVSLREAIASINAGSNTNTDVVPTGAAYGTNDTILFQSGLIGPITLSSGALPLARDMTIQGPGASALTVGGSSGDGFRVNTGAAVISGLTISGNGGAGVHIFSAGTVTDSVTSGNSGGGILNSGAGLVTIANTTASGNGQYSVNNNAGGAMRITNSAISGNNFGILNFGIGRMMLVNSTVSGNGTGVIASGTLAVVNSTISGNTGDGIQEVRTLTVVDSTLSGNGTGIHLLAGTLTLGNSIVAGNTTDITGSVTTDLGHNLIGGAPLLAPLGNYGGATQTRALLAASPAIDIIPVPCPAAYHDTITTADVILTTDQRGFPRLAGSGCDAGSVEFRGFVPTSTGGDGQSTLVTSPFANPLALSLVANETGGAVSGIPVTFSLPASGASATFDMLAGCTLTNGNLTATCPSDSGGVATSPPLRANGTPGGFRVTVSAPGTSALLFSLTNIPAPTMTSAQDASVSFSATAQSVILTASVTSTVGTVNAGMLTFTVLRGATPIGTPVTSPTLTTGTASVSYVLPANTQSGAYTIQAVYSGGGGFLPGQDITHILTVSAAPLTSIALSGPGGVTTLILKVGQSMPVSAMGIYADHSTQPLPAGQVQWQLGDATKVTVDANGNLTGQSPGGPVTVTVTQGGVTGTIMVTVVPLTPIGITVPPAPASRPSSATSGTGLLPPAPVPVPSGSPSSGTRGGTAPNLLPTSR